MLETLIREGLLLDLPQHLSSPLVPAMSDASTWFYNIPWLEELSLNLFVMNKIHRNHGF